MDNILALSKHSSYERGRRNRHALGGPGYRRSLEGWADRAGPAGLTAGEEQGDPAHVPTMFCVSDGAKRLNWKNCVLDGVNESRCNMDVIYPMCEEHDCPMVPVGETGWECVVERLSDHLVGHIVARVDLSKARTMLVFDDGHELDLLCPNCGGALHSGDDTYIFEVVAGMTLSAVYYNEPGGTPGLLFVFSGKCNRVGEVVSHAMSGKRMRCPEGCAHNNGGVQGGRDGKCE